MLCYPESPVCRVTYLFRMQRMGFSTTPLTDRDRMLRRQRAQPSVFLDKQYKVSDKKRNLKISECRNLGRIRFVAGTLSVVCGIGLFFNGRLQRKRVIYNQKGIKRVEKYLLPRFGKL